MTFWLGRRSAGLQWSPTSFGLTKAFLEVAAKMLSNPYRLAETQMNLWWDYSALWQSSMFKLMGQSPARSPSPPRATKRFRHEDWQSIPVRHVKQSYLLTARWLHDAVASVEGLDERTQKKVDFLPVNNRCARAFELRAHQSRSVSAKPFPRRDKTWSRGSQPARRHRAWQRQAQNSMTDSKAFELGVNIATTPAKSCSRTTSCSSSVRAPDKRSISGRC